MPPHQIVQSPVNSPINKTIWLNASTGFFCGGVNGKEGYICKTVDGGKSWVNVYSQNQNALYDIFFVNDSTGYACGEKMLLLKSENYGQKWTSTNHEINSDNFYKGTLYALFGNDKLLLIAGGYNFNVGIVTWIKNNQVQTYWTGFKGADNEFRCGTVFENGSYMALGFGTAYKSPGQTDSLVPSTIDGDFFTGCATLSASERMLCGYNGGIYKLSNNGQSIVKLMDGNRAFKKRIRLNGIAFNGALKGCAVGDKGVVLLTNNGKDFQLINFPNNEDFLSVSVSKNNEFVISTQTGKLITLPF